MSGSVKLFSEQCSPKSSQAEIRILRLQFERFNQAVRVSSLRIQGKPKDLERY